MPLQNFPATPRFPRPVPATCLPLLFLFLLLAGCSKIGAVPTSMDVRLAQLSSSALNSGSPSERTLLVLKQRDLAASWRTDVRRTILVLDAEHRAEPERETLFALMELAFLGARLQPADSEEQAVLLLTCVVYASDFLFDESLTPRPSLFDPASRQACEFYNRSLARLVANFRARGLRAKAGTRLPFLTGDLELGERRSDLAWKPEEFDHVFLAYEFRVKGLDEEYGSQGLGAPLIAVRTPPAAAPRRASERYLPRIRQTYPATVLLRVEPAGKARERLGRPRKASLELYDPIKTSEIQIEGRTTPLQTDLTTPLAYMMQMASPPEGLVGLIKPEEWSESQGLHMLEPYEQDKIPVVFVHGLLSTPLTWLPMLNSLMGDPKLRERYQFWFFMYPTGNPILYSASLLRGALDEARETFDPQGDDPAFNRMVLIGHSMGGLLSRTAIQDSGDVLWKTFSATPPEELGLSAKEMELVRDVFFFTPRPYVSRVLFLATPHRGSDLATGTIGAIGASLVTLPFNLVKGALSVVGKLGEKAAADPDAAILASRLKRLPTGIDGLAPDNQVLLAGAALPMVAPFHSIIGDEKGPDRTGGTDGIVPYSSAHLDAAQSELVVRSGHSVQDRPRTVREVRRILLEHAGAAQP